jgi:hypothetical protein
MARITLPTFLFGSLISWLIGASIHLFLGGKFVRLVFSILFAWIGFWVGNYIGDLFGIAIFNYGQINYFSSIVVSLLMGLGGIWISGENTFDES